MENISLRDQFAMAAMQGELSGQRDGCEWANEIYLADRAYEIADAMLAARDKNSGRLKAIKSAAQSKSGEQGLISGAEALRDLADEMAKAMQSKEPIVDMKVLAALCFQYAEAMLAEEEKRKDTARPSVLCEQYPNWNNAPEWANYWAFDQNGLAHWFENEPVIEDEVEWVYGSTVNRHEQDKSFCIGEKWKGSLYTKPKEPQQ